MRLSFLQEIIGIVALKIVVLYILWNVCFSHPLDKTLISSDIASHLLKINSD